MATHTMSQEERIAAIRREGLIESGAHLFSAVSALYAGNLNARQAALNADWANTRALYDEAVLQDELLEGMAMAEVAQAQTGFARGAQYAMQTRDAVGKMQAARRSLRLRARAAAARAAFEGSGARARGSSDALGSSLKAAGALERVGERLRALE